MRTALNGASAAAIQAVGAVRANLVVGAYTSLSSVAIASASASTNGSLAATRSALQAAGSLVRSSIK